ncbi:DUF3616 domain-containing protein [Fischerella thermalis]|jgi:hypothetical protein|uniref:DUF3616 domain-containing protein n=1 Tax=Fischerella thermalis JSC-11 TaxID=741277 RepID=G6FVF8_9CYAN|nr:DUF3616 domain-containing protein [Fischerella thermalis]EHC12213.1 hypothetical protein FJSC11DRAFT_2855 [Fischerella thermalis JSC-11]PLZ09009.1 hypothetical protein CBP18_12585 [Fischerella thermalis WC119]PLZ10417.1 hypothetical protein CBP17_11020 [Fischerella thermalis WC114]PLZ15605.1 hypothetical protein CBP19_06750 [Fischerella thermalis WC1110]PLZ21361.1 hypothetical protein CBP30_08285 [Fischerella thermalis WC157]
MKNSTLLNKVLLTFTDGFKEHREDLSAVMLTPEKHLWFGSDETSTIERLSYINANHFGEHKQFRVAEFIDLPAPEEEEIDIEGIEYSDSYLWIIGSHSWKRKKPKLDKSDIKNIQRLAKVASEPNRYILARIPLVNGELCKSCPHPEDANMQLTAAKLQLTESTNILMEVLADDPHLGFFVTAKIPGKDNGFDIEGIAVHQNRIFLGLRGPVLRGWAVILEIEVELLQTGLLTLKPIVKTGQCYKKHFVFLNGLGIRDLHLAGEDLLILAGPTMDLDGPVQVYRLHVNPCLQDDVLHYPEYVQDIPFGNRDDHAEGITLFEDISGIPSLLVVYDSPANHRLVSDDSVIADVFKLG